MNSDHGIPHDFDEAALARRRSVAHALTVAPTLIRFALKFTGSLEDAEDAYQRGMEIALREGPDTDPASFLNWLHIIIRNEAMRLARIRRRETPHIDDELIELAGTTTEGYNDGLRVVTWRERYRTVQDALGGLNDAQRVCLILRTAGASHGEIGEITGFSPRQVERSIVEGRARLRDGELQLGAGRRCGEIAPLIDLVVDGGSTAADRRRLTRHTRHCAACRTAFRARRDQSRLLASLVPGLLVAPGVMPALGPDPTLAIGWWDRVSTGATVRMGHLTQLWFDIPALASTRAGASAIVAATAAALGTPMVVQAMRDEPTPRPAPVVARAPAPVAPVAPVRQTTPTVTTKPAATIRRPAVPRPATKPRTASSGTRLSATRSASTTTRRSTSPPPTYSPPRQTAPTPAGASGGTSSSSAAQEFGP